MKSIVLAGGGHANALALLQLGGRKNVVLVSDGAYTPYSGLLPGFIAGTYRREQCFIDLAQTSTSCQAEFINARVVGLDKNALLLADGRRLAFDVLSLNVGAAPAPPVMSANVCAVKPIADFMRWLAVQDEALVSHVAVVGGGAGGVETLLALAHRWRDKTPRPAFTLVARRFLPTTPAALRRHVRRRLAACAIDVVEATATGYEEGQLHLAEGRLGCSHVVYATPVAAAPWFVATGLPLDDGGFMRVNACLQSPAADNVFISGDAAAHTPPLPKSGVMAVRQSAVLAHNLQVAADGRGEMKRFNAAAAALMIIGDGDGKGAVASRNGLVVSGKWVWRWKQYLDFGFMGKFT